METQSLVVTEQQTAAWVALATKKNEVVASLTTSELELQQILLAADQTDYTKIDSSLAVYRKKLNELIESRKEFTSVINSKLIEPLMAFEKRADYKVNETYLKLNATALQLKKEDEAKKLQAQAIERERSAYTAHIVNQIAMIESTYRSDLKSCVEMIYAEMLQHKSPKPNYDNIQLSLRAVAKVSGAKMQTQHLSVDEKAAIYTAVKKPDYDAILAQFVETLPDYFINYDSDLSNAKQAIVNREIEAKLRKQKEDKQLAANAAVNNLIAQAAVPVVDMPKIKREMVIEKENSAFWAQAIIGTFLANMPTLQSYCRVKEWANLSIGQMADAIAKHGTETGEQFKGITYKTVEK